MRYIEVLEGCLGRKAEKNLLPLQVGDVPDTWADAEDLVRDVGYRPSTPVEEGVAKFVGLVPRVLPGWGPARHGSRTLADAFASHARRLAGLPVRALFAADPDRFAHFSREAAACSLDFSRQRLDADALGALVALAGACGLRARIARALRGRAESTQPRVAPRCTRSCASPAGSRHSAGLAPLHAEVLAVRAQCACLRQRRP